MKTVTVRMKANDVAEVLLYDQVGRDPWFGDGIGAKQFRETIKAIKAGTINLRINSPGGSVTEAAAMLAALDEHPARVEVDIDGLAASAASVIAMSGDVIRVAANGLVMIHNPYAGVLGGAEDMRRMAGVLDKIKEQAITAYERHSKAGREQLAAWLDAETWFTGQEAVDAGLAHEVTGAQQVAAFADLTRFGYRNPPAPPAAKVPTPEEWEATRQRQAIAAKLATVSR